MANSIAYTKNYTAVLDEVYKRAACSTCLNSQMCIRDSPYLQRGTPHAHAHAHAGIEQGGRPVLGDLR